MTVNPATFTNNGSVASSIGNLSLGGTTLTNAGTITLGTGTAATINPTNFNNAGSLAANGSTLNLTPTGTYANSGTLALNSGTLNLGGAFVFSDLGSGHYSRATGTTVNMVSGTLDLGGNTLDIGSAGLFGTGGLNTFAGTIKNGTLISADGTVLNNAGGTLDKVAIGSNLSTNSGALYFNSGVTLADGVTLNNGGGTWYFRGSYWGTGGTDNQSILTSGAATLQMNGASLYSYNYPPNSQTITIGAGVTVKGYGTIGDGWYQQSWVNNGSIIASTAGQTMTVNPAAFANNGTVGVAAGATFYRPAGFTNNGIVSGTGTISVGTGTSGLVNQGSINPGGTGAAGTLAISGDLTFGTGSVLTLEVGGVITGQFDTLKVSGAVSGTAGAFGGLTLAKINGFGFFNPNGDSFPLVSAASGLDSGSFAATSLARNYLTPSYTSNVFSMLAVPYVLTVNPDAVSGVYGAPDPTITYSATGFDTSTTDSVATAFSGALSRATGNNVGSYAYNKGTLFSPLGYVVKLGTNTGTSFSITPANLSVTANAASKTYDGTAYSGGNGVTYAGFVLGDTATALGGTLGYGGTSQGAVNTGNYTITPSGLTSSNYRINYFDGTLTILAAGINLINLTGQRAYDGTANVAAGIFSLGGLVPGQNLTLTGVGTIPSQNAGTYSVTLGTLALGDGTGTGAGLASNYTLTGGTHVATILPVTLTYTANLANRLYGAANPAFSGSVSGFVANETLASATTGTALFDSTATSSSAVGSYPITGSGLTANFGNYAFTQAPGNATALTINPAQITAVPISGSLTGSTSKVYDGTTAATLTPANYSLTGWVSTDGATVSKTSGTFDTANAGTGKTVTVSLAGSDYVPTGSTALSNYTLPTVVSGAIGSITPAPLSVSTNSVSKVYDGGLAANGAAAVVSAGTLFGSDTLSGGSFAYTDKNVGAGNKTVTVGGVVVNDGNSGANYTVSYANNVTSAITQRPLSTWTAPGSGQWSNAGNWDALPDGTNVLAVSIPAGVSVVYDAAVGTTSLQSVSSAGGFSLAGGNLSIAGSLTTPQYNQSGGALSVANTINVNGSFSQSAGTIAAGGPVNIVQNSGNLIVGAIQAPAISLTALAGNIGQTAGLNSTGLLSTQSTGSTVLNDAGNRLASFKAVSSGAGNIEMTNVGVLDVQGISAAAGDIVLNNTGGISTSGLVQANVGAVTMTANSPLTIGSSGISAYNSITLTATNLTSSGNMTLNGPLTSFAGGITLNAANNFVQNSSLTAALAINVSAGGSMTFGPFAMSTGNPVNYYINGQPLAPPWLAAALGASTGDVVVTFLSEFQDSLEALLIDYGYSDPLAQYRQNKSSIVVEGNICSR